MKKTVSLNERYKQGFIPWDGTKNEAKLLNLSSWTQYYHKPYTGDWRESHNKALNRLWRYRDDE